MAVRCSRQPWLWCYPLLPSWAGRHAAWRLCDTHVTPRWVYRGPAYRASTSSCSPDVSGAPQAALIPYPGRYMPPTTPQRAADAVEPSPSNPQVVKLAHDVATSSRGHEVD